MTSGKRTAQTSIFIILALIIFFILGLITYLKIDMVLNQLRENAVPAIDPSLVKQGIIREVQQCLEWATDEALYLVGRQGGAVISGVD